jgi:hypothetical protein
MQTHTSEGRPLTTAQCAALLNQQGSVNVQADRTGATGNIKYAHMH